MAAQIATEINRSVVNQMAQGVPPSSTKIIEWAVAINESPVEWLRYAGYTDIADAWEQRETPAPESPRHAPESPGAGEAGGERDDVPPEVIAFYNDDALSLEAKERMTALLKALWQEEQRILRERQAHEPPPEGKG